MTLHSSLQYVKLPTSWNYKKFRGNGTKQFFAFSTVMFGFCYISLCVIKTDYNHIQPYSIGTSPIRKVFLVTYTRSGSSFLGQILRSIPSSFYFYEPLRFYADKKRPMNYTEMRGLIHDLFNCEFESRKDYLNWLKRHKVFSKNNENFWDVCANGTDSSNCFNKTFNALYCQKTLYRVMKVVRYPPRDLLHLMTESPDMRVIYLVRDPRGVLKSRSRVGGCKKLLECTKYCSDLHKDLKFLCLLPRDYTNSIFVLRYEDMGCHPEQMAVQLMKFLGIPEVPQSVQDFIRNNTKNMLKEKHAYNTRAYTVTRDSAETAFAWQKSSDSKYIGNIQTKCGDVIKILGWDLLDESRREPLTCEADTNNVTDQYLPIRDICARSDLD